MTCWRSLSIPTSFLLSSEPPAGRNAGHHRNHLGDILFGDRIALRLGFFLPLHFGKFQLADQFGFFVAQVGCLFVLLVFDRLVFFSVPSALRSSSPALRCVQERECFSGGPGAHFIQHVDSLCLAGSGR